MKITKEKIIIYPSILKNSNRKIVVLIVILKYLCKRLFGTNKDFKLDKTVIIKDNNLFFNCGKIFNNCKIAMPHFEPEIKKIIALNKKGTFVDVGCHIGKFSIYSAKKGYDVISIDANNEVLDLLKQNMQLNNCEDKIKVINCLCTDKIDSIKYYQSELSPGTNSIVYTEKRIAVIKKTNKLDNLLSKEKRISIIKIDVEGSELLVLKGSKKIILKHKPLIIFEALSKKEKEGIEKYLFSFGYNVKRIGEHNYVAKIQEGRNSSQP